MLNPYEIEVVHDGRDFGVCCYCGFAGIGWISHLTNGETVLSCDICGRQSTQNFGGSL